MLKSTLEQWRMFQSVARAGGFNQASEQIHKSQSSIHHAVQKLEASLGVSLFETRARRVHLTPAGELMLHRADFLLTEAAKMESLASTLSDGVESELTIAVDHAFPYEMVYQSINRVVADYALLCIHLRETVLSGANELLQSAEVNLAISPFPLSGCLNEELCSVQFTAVAAPHHALHSAQRQDHPLALADLKGYRQIVVRDSGSQTATDQGWLGADSRWTVDHLRTSVDLVIRGLGFAWLPDSLIETALVAGTLAPLDLGESSCRHVMFYLNYMDPDGLGPAARHFMDALRHHALQV